MINLDKINKIHFIGIGGIGVSAIARMMLLNGKEIRGSDESLSLITDKLSKSGAKIFAKHSAENLCSDTDLVVYTTAIDSNNPELEKAKRFNIPTLTYPEILGLVSRNHYTIAISGTHGKTTTTAMIAEIAINAGLDPTVIVGSVLKNSRNSNFIAGMSNLFIVEACEYKRSFLNLQPNILVITNIDKDHLDYYKDLAGVQSAFAKLVEKLSPDSFVVCNLSDPKVVPVLKNAKCKIVNYTLSGKVPNKLKLKVPGKYNQDNAKAAFAVSEILKVEENAALKALSEFEGVWRRFEHKGKTENGAEVYDDYAHHPTEIRATLAAARNKFPDKKIIVVFQPHLYSRTKLLLNDFSESFINVDEVILAPIYAAREKYDKSINSSMLRDEINKKTSNAEVYYNFSDIEMYLRENMQKGDIIITMGAGDIYKIGENLIK